MRKLISVTICVSAAALALAVTPLAAAAYTPSMGIFQANYKPGGAGAVTIVVAQEPADDPTARIVIYAGPGYTTALGQAPGTTIGSVVAEVRLPQGGGTKAFTLTGPVKVENPASWAAQGAACSGLTPEAVWSLNTTLAGQATVIPVFVNHTAGAEAAFSSAKLTVCFRNPALPQPQGWGGTRFVSAAFRVRSVFRNPSKAGTPIWRSIFTPWAPGSPALNPGGTREAQAVVPMPYTLSLRRVRARRGFFRVAGSLNRAGSRPSGASVALYIGVRRKGGIRFRQFGREVKTRRGGKFVFNRRLPKRMAFVFVQRLPAPVPCSTAIALAPCSAAIESNAISRVIRIAPRRRR